MVNRRAKEVMGSRWWVVGRVCVCVCVCGTAIRAEHIVGLCRRAVWECVCRGVCEAVRLFGASGGFLKIY